MNCRIIALEVEEAALPVWRAAFAAQLPDVEIVSLHSLPPSALVEAAVVWNPPPGLLGAMPQLRFVLSRGAGVDSLLDPRRVPHSAMLLRMRDPVIADKMAEFVVLSVLYLHRDWLDVHARQTDRRWRGDTSSRAAGTRTVGILGLGELGRVAAERLNPFGFRLIGWSRERRSIAEMETFSGRDGLDALVSRSDILVNLLPLTPQTENLIDARLMERLPRGAMLVNAGRGATLVESDLVAALDQGQLSGAILDVTREEPLPESHPFWTHPKVVVTQHGAAVLRPEEEAQAAARILGDAFAGRELPERVERDRGY